MNRQSSHLTFSDLVAMLRKGGAERDAGGSHLSQCAECRGVLTALEALEETGSPTPGAGLSAGKGPCLTSEQIALLAAGTAAADAPGWLDHIVGCDRCGDELRSAIETIHAALSPAELRLIEQVVAPSGAVRPHLAAVPGKPWPAMRWRTYGAIAAGILLAVAGVVSWRIYSSRKSAERLLAQSYTRQRLLDYRLPDEGYAPVTRMRGPEAPELSELAQARAELAPLLERGHPGARVLRLHGLAELQSLRADTAVDALGQARALRPKDADILCDLGTALAERGELEDRPEDFARSLEYLGQALLAEPGLSRALFNRALVLERMNLFEDAIAAWGQYLARDGSSRWAAEARERLAALRARIKGHADRRGLLSGGPEALAQPASAGISPDLFLDAAVFRWLASPPSPAAAGLIQGLARTLAEQNGDIWLHESLREVPPGQPLWSRLQAAVEANIRGETGGFELASDTRDAAIAAGARTFAKRAEFEAIYALDRMQRAEACAERASRFLDHEAAVFPWLGAAMRTEKANCMVMLGREGEADALLAEAARLAQDHGLKAQWMRARGIRIGVNTNAGDPWSTFAQAPQFLKDYWSDGYSPGRLQQVAFSLSTASQFMGYPNAACEFGEAAARAISETGNRRVEALTRAHVSALALSAGQTALAAEQAAWAERFFRHDEDPAAAAYRTDAALAAADADLASGDFAALERRLRPYAPGAAPLPTYLLELRRSRLLAAEAMHRRDWEASRQALDRALGELHRRLDEMPDPEQRVALFQQAAPLYRMRAQVDLEDGRREQALGSALDLFSLAGGGSARGLRPPKGDTWLVYLCLARKVAAWVVTESGIHFRWVPGTREELAARIGRMGELAGARAGDTGALRALAAELFAELIGLPPAALCESCRLVIVPDGEIAAAPFSALVDSRGAFLGLTVPLIRAHRLPPPPGQRGLTGHGLLLMAGAAVERPGLTLPRLPEVEVEAQYVAASAPASIRAGSALAADRLKELAPAAAWLHFAGHGYANAGNGALFTAGAAGAPISASQITKMNWSRCELAVLSACWAGAGESRGFVNPESLVQAFLTAGARGVVAPVWAIDSAGAAGWMREFYSAMRRGMDAPLAIREASRRMSRQSGFELPYYWASFAYFT